MTSRSFLIAACLAAFAALCACEAPPSARLQPSPRTEIVRTPAKPLASTPLVGAPASWDADDVAMADVVRTRHHIVSEYVKPAVPSSQLFLGMAKGMVQALGDPHSEFITPGEAKAFMENLQDTFSGIGAVLRAHGEIIVIAEVLKGSPAEKSKLRVGDWIFTVDGAETRKKPLEEVIRHIRGDAGTVVHLGIIRNGRTRVLDVAITRGDVVLPTVDSRIVSRGGKRFMLISFLHFTTDSGERFRAAAEEAVRKHVDGIAFDLRDNPGGLMRVAVDVVCLWERGKPVLFEQQRDVPMLPAHCEPGKAILSGMRTAVLVNGFSASASEITAGALQDYGKAKIIGEKTYGKGSAQQVFRDYPDGSLLKLTIAEWLTPNGHAVNGIGITPDIIVPSDPKARARGRDVRLERAYRYLLTGK